MRVHLITVIAALLHLANAGAMTVSGNVSLLPAPPVAAGPGDLVSGTNAFFWTERYDLSLPSPLAMDVIPFQNNAVGMYTSNAPNTQSTWSGLLASGNYDSFMLHAETPSKKFTSTGSITFDEDIVGIIFDQATLGTTDLLLGAVGTIYAGSGDNRGFELNGPSNWFSVSPDRRTFAFQTVVNQNINEVRIVTNAQSTLTAVPVPASIFLFGSALCLLVWTKRR